MADPQPTLSENPYPEFFQAVVGLAYPGDLRRIREAHSGWSGPREYPLLYSDHGFADPKIGQSFKTLWLKCEEKDEGVRAWRRRGPHDWAMSEPFERIDPDEFGRRREEAERRMRLPPRQRVPMPDYYLLVGEPPLGERVDPHIPERDFFLVLLANQDFLRDVVVSRDDVQAAPILPDTVSGGYAQALWKRRPEGRQGATLKTMMAEIGIETSRNGKKEATRLRQFQEALRLLNDHDSEKWPLRARKRGA
jgi:hypothetical protein